MNLQWDNYIYDERRSLDFGNLNYLVFYPKKQLVRYYTIKSISGDAYKQIIKRALCFAFLNPEQPDEVIGGICKVINTNCTNKLEIDELLEVIEEVMDLRKDPELENMVRSQARSERDYKGYVINPDLPEERVNQIKGIALGEYRKERALTQLRNLLNNWKGEWVRPSNSNLAKKLKWKISKVNRYTPELKKEKQDALERKALPVKNNYFMLLSNILLKWNLNKGVPTNKDLAKNTVLGLRTIEKVSPQLKGLKQRLRKAFNDKNDNRESLVGHFPPFDSNNYVMTLIEWKREKIMDYENEIYNEILIEAQEVLLKKAI